MTGGGYDSPADAPAVAAPDPAARTGRVRDRQQWLERRVPRWAAFAGTVALLIALLAVFVTGLVWIADIVAQRAPQYAGRVAELAAATRARLGALGLPAPENGPGLGGSLPIADLLDRTMAALALITLTLAFTILGLIDVRRVLGVPITVLIVIVAHRSERIRWIGNLLGEVRGRRPGARG